MSRPIENPGVRIGMAAVSRVDQGLDAPLNLTGCIEAVEHPTSGAKRTELVEAIAYLAAQVVGYQNSADRDAQLAMHQITSAVDAYREKEVVMKGHVMAALYALSCLIPTWLNLRKGAKR